MVLNPFAEQEISEKDRKHIIKHGLVVIDCSWRKILDSKDLDFGIKRKLPSLLAVNPVNFGKWEKLSSAEAIAAALYIAGFYKKAKEIMSKFKWGKDFLKLNFQST